MTCTPGPLAPAHPLSTRPPTHHVPALPPTHPARPPSSQVELVEPPPGAAVGERVTVEGFPGEPDEQLNPKKKVFEAVQPDLATSAERVACYKGVPLMTSAGPCTAPSVAGGSIR